MRRRPLVLLCLGVILIILLLRALALPLLPVPEDVRKAAAYFRDPHDTAVTGRVKSCRSVRNYTLCILEDASFSLRSENCSLGNVMIRINEDRHICAGRLLCVRGFPEEIASPGNPGQFDRSLYYRVRGICFEIRDPEILSESGDPAVFAEALIRARDRFAAQIRAVYPEDVSGILTAMLTGDRTELNEETRELWQAGSVAHLLCISGLHISALASAVLALLQILRLPRRLSALLSAVILAAYSLMTGLAAATLRALVMFLLRLLARETGRTYDPLTALAAAALLILLENPWNLFYSGFLLSFGAVFLCTLLEGRGRGTSALLLFLGLLPLQLLTSYCFSPYSVLLNLLLIPLLPVILLLALAGLGLALIPGLAPFAAYPAAYLLRGAEAVLTVTRTLPGAMLVSGRPSLLRTALYLALLAGWSFLFARRRNRAGKLLLLPLLPLLLLVLVLRLPSAELSYAQLDVGQGDCCVLTLPGGAAVMVDAGSSSDPAAGSARIEPFLLSEGISKIDTLVLTHMDSDHISGAREILTRIAERRTPVRIRRVCFPTLKEEGDVYRQMAELAEAAGAEVLRVSAGDLLENGAVRLEVLGPDPALEEIPVDENAQCVVLGVHYGSFDLLLTGDVCGAGEEAVTEQLRREHTDWEVLKAAHHGSKYSTPDAFLEAARPEIAVISAGAENSYGHPHPELLARLASHGCAVFRTDRDGAVLIRSDGERYFLKCFREAAAF